MTPWNPLPFAFSKLPTTPVPWGVGLFFDYKIYCCEFDSIVSMIVVHDFRIALSPVLPYGGTAQHFDILSN